MQLKKGSYSFPVGAVNLKAQSRQEMDAAMRPKFEVRTFECEGYLYASGQTAIDTALSGLRTALLRQDEDLLLFLDNGSQSTTILPVAGSIGGVKVIVGPSFTDNVGTEYVLQRKFMFVCEARYVIPNTSNRLVEFYEEIKFSGGGPTYHHFPSMNGFPQKQQLYANTAYVAVQSGRAIGLYFRPSAPGPIWPSALMRSPDIHYITPNLLGSPGTGSAQYINWGITWEYYHESIAPLVGAPNLWPANA